MPVRFYFSINRGLPLCRARRHCIRKSTHQDKSYSHGLEWSCSINPSINAKWKRNCDFLPASRCRSPLLENLFLHLPLLLQILLPLYSNVFLLHSISVRCGRILKRAQLKFKPFIFCFFFFLLKSISFLKVVSVFRNFRALNQSHKFNICSYIYSIFQKCLYAIITSSIMTRWNEN